MSDMKDEMDSCVSGFSMVSVGGEEMSAESMRTARGLADPNRSGRSHSPLLAELLADRDYHHTRAETAEAEAAQLLADLADMKRERDDGRRAHIRCAFGSACHVMARSPAEPFAPPVRCTTHEQVAEVWGWSYLYPEEPSR